jgi:hypothetical protein
MKSKKLIKAVVINARNHTATILESEWTLDDLQAAVGGYIENGSIQPDVSVWVDEEGLLKSPEYFFFIPGITNNPLAGNAVIMGVDDEGNNIDISTNTLTCMLSTLFFHRDQLQTIL